MLFRSEVLIPAALGGVINSENVSRVNTSFIIEGANQPTTIDADKDLRAGGIVIVPDILANAGGVMGSYFEWTQNIQQFSWPIDKFRQELDSRMAKSLNEVFHEAKKHSIDIRTAAYVLAVKRVAASFQLRGHLV